MQGLLKYALAICIILGAGLDSLARPSPRDEVEVAQILLPVDLGDITSHWESCSSWNGAYYLALRHIALCEENLDEGVEVARFIFLHELGHAYTFTRGTDFTRWEFNYEASADEFAAIMSIVQGHPEDVWKTAILFDRYGREHPVTPGDPHPAWDARVQMLLDMYMGYTFPYSPWKEKYRAALRYWRGEFMERP